MPNAEDRDAAERETAERDVAERETARLNELLAERFALHARGELGEAELRAAAEALVRHFVAVGMPPERAIRGVKEAVPWDRLAALPEGALRGRDAHAVRDAIVKWSIHEYFRERERARAEGRLHER